MRTIKILYHTNYRRYSFADLIEQTQATPSFLLQIYCFFISLFFFDVFNVALALFNVFLNKMFFFYFLMSYDLSIFNQPLVCNAFLPLFHKWNMPYLPK